MREKPKYSKEIKIKACHDYENNNGSFEGIAKSIGAGETTIRLWYLRYKEHGPDVFETPTRNRAYNKEFKITVIKEYDSGEYSLADLSAKYNISVEVIRGWFNKWYNGIDIKDYDPKGDVYTMKSRKTTFEERLEIVNWVIENDMGYKNAAEKYSITYALVYRWTRAYLKEGSDALKYKNRGPRPKASFDESNLTEVEKLKLELEKEKALRKRREFEIEVLKKKEEFERNLHFQK